MSKRVFTVSLTGLFLLLFVSFNAYGEVKSGLPKELTSESKKCIECHSSTTVGIYQQWGQSKHFRANVGCYECHEAKKAPKVPSNIMVLTYLL